MSEVEKHKPVLDEDGEDTERIIDEKDPTKESTGERQDYQHVVDRQTGERTGKVITPDGRVLTGQEIPAPRPILPDLANPGGGFSISIGDINIPKPLVNITEPLVYIPEPLIDVDLPEFSIPEKVVNIEFKVDIPEPLVDIDMPEVVIPEKAVNIELKADIPQPLVDIDITEPLIQADIPEPLIDVDVKGPLVEFPEIPELPEKIVDLSITEPLIEIPPFPEWPQFPEIPEDLVSIVGPLVEMPEIPEGVIQIGDITMPDVVGGIDIDLPEIPEGVQYGAVGVGVLIGLGFLLLGIGRTASAVKGITKTVTKAVK